jgi:molecular chaperone DnaK
MPRPEPELLSAPLEPPRTETPSRPPVPARRVATSPPPVGWTAAAAPAPAERAPAAKPPSIPPPAPPTPAPITPALFAPPPASASGPSSGGSLELSLSDGAETVPRVMPRAMSLSGPLTEAARPSLPEPPSTSGPPPRAAPRAGLSARPAVPTKALLLDVTPQTLGVQTVQGYCDHIIPRNAAIPVEQTRIFTTSSDAQEAVVIRICQGEARRIDQNVVLGQLELQGIRPAPRGEVEIAVTFEIDSDGLLNVSAKDLETGRAQRTQITLFGGYSEEEVEEMTERSKSLHVSSSSNG